MRKRKNTAEQKLKRALASKKRTCHTCSYYRDGYCSDIDARVNPDEPVCSDEYYNS